MNHYIEILKASQLKATVQRLSILEIISHSGHITIDSIYQQINQTHPTLSLATIYKNILLMVEKDVLIEVPIAGSKSYYELKKQDHIHIICQECGAVEDKRLDDRVCSLSFDTFITSHVQINIYGICSNCQ